MGKFTDFMSKIFHTNVAERPVDAAPPSGATPPRPTPSTTPAGNAPLGTPTATPAQTVDVSAVLEGLAAKSSEKLDWKHSIVDMMKLLGLDSSLAARKELAEDLGYTGDMSDSAKMNIWLHKEVMTKLAANGGKVPPELMHH
jgi:hypothetical protein